jgi:hypothetical protein
MSCTLAIKARKVKSMRFPGNPICKTGPKPLKKGGKKVTFLHLDAGKFLKIGQKTGTKTHFQPMFTVGK